MNKSKLIKELNKLQLSSGYGLSDDYLIENTYAIGRVFHNNNATQYLANTETLSKFILDNISETDNKRLYIYADYFLKKYVWLESAVKTVYLRPDIEYLPRALYMPEVITAEDFMREFGHVVYHEKQYGKQDHETDKYIYISNYNAKLYKEYDRIDKQCFSSFYLNPSNKLKNKMDNNYFNLFYNVGEYRYPLNLEFVEHDNGMMLILVAGSNCIGQRYCAYMKIDEVRKLYTSAYNAYADSLSKI